MRFIGFYDYTVILTYMSLLSSVYGITQAFHEHYGMAVFCLAISGICDAFDGRVARCKKNRTAEEKAFGIQLDSLCDVICFGLFPAFICYLMGVRGTLGLCLCFFYTLCAVIRLAYFNVMEEKRQKTEGGSTKYYRGLPVTSIAFIMPIVFWVGSLLPDKIFLVVLHLMLLTVGTLFVVNFPLKKPSLKGLLVIIALTAVIVGAVFAFSKFQVPDHRDENNPLTSDEAEVLPPASGELHENPVS